MSERMITYRQGDVHFNCRAVAIFLDGGRVLLHRAGSNDFWALPGGRCELMESSEETIRREMREELDLEAQVERLVWVVETFAQSDEVRLHEIGFYFLMALPAGTEFIRQESFVRMDGDTPLLFQWFRLEDLPGLPLFPPFLRTELACLPKALTHIVDRDVG